MKKKTIYIISLLIILSFGILGYYELFGHIKSSEIIIENFSKTTVDSLIPDINKGYSTQIIKINGNVDDTIRVKGFYGNSIYLARNIDKEYYVEYYGGTPAFMLFEPYKAKKGKLKIKHIIR